MGVEDATSTIPVAEPDAAGLSYTTLVVGTGASDSVADDDTVMPGGRGGGGILGQKGAEG